MTEISDKLKKFVETNILLIKKDEINYHDKLSKKIAQQASPEITDYGQQATSTNKNSSDHP